MIKNLALLFVWCVLRWFIYVLPKMLVLGVCGMLGGLAVRSGRGALMRDELRLLQGGLSDDEYKGMAKKAYASMIKDEEERLFFDRKKRMLSIVDFEGLDYLDNALSRGRGAVLALMHFSNHLLVIPALGYKGYSVCQLAEAGPSEQGPDKIGLLAGMVRRRRRHIGDKMPARIIIADRLGKRAHEALKNNGVLLCAVDGRLGANMRQYDFLGRPMLLSNGIFRIAQSCRAPIMPLFIVRGDNGVHTLTIGRPIEYSSPDDGVERFLGVFKGYFLKYPHFYAPNLMFERIRAGHDKVNPLFLDYGKAGHERAS
ncbi:MAG: lysophospholipid acyltransferase family protein [Deltaproteobacteria bacterium]